MPVGVELYDLVKDPDETKNLAAAESDVVKHLSELAEKARADMGDQLTKRTGTGGLAPGRVD